MVPLGPKKCSKTFRRVKECILWKKGINSLKDAWKSYGPYHDGLETKETFPKGEKHTLPKNKLCFSLEFPFFLNMCQNQETPPKNNKTEKFSRIFHLGIMYNIHPWLVGWCCPWENDGDICCVAVLQFIPEEWYLLLGENPSQISVVGFLRMLSFMSLLGFWFGCHYLRLATK